MTRTGTGTPMIVPTRSEFASLARGGRLVPVYREVFADHETPVSAFRKVDEGPYSFLLESVEGGEKWGRFSILGSRPSAVFTARGSRCELLQNGVVTFNAVDPAVAEIALNRNSFASHRPTISRFCFDFR